MNNAGKNWTEAEITLALVLYLRTPYSKITRTNPEIIELAQSLGRTPGSVSLKLANLASCDPKVAQAGRKGKSHGAKSDKIVWDRYIGAGRLKSLDRLMTDAEAILSETGIRPTVVGLAGVSEPQDTDGLTLVRRRRHQAYFRETVMQMYDRRCVVTGLAVSSLLEVAHIIPWSENEALRLVPANGLTLNPLIHRAYDAHLIGIDGDMKIHVARDLIAASDGKLLDLFNGLNGASLRLPPNVAPNPDYLSEHFRHFDRDVTTSPERLLAAGARA